jgi:hypothetical protein
MVKKVQKTKILKWEKATVDERARMLIEVLPDRKMDQKKLKTLLETATPEDQVKLKVLHNAVVNCIRDYKDESTSVKLKDWRSAESALDGFIDDLWEEHFGEGRVTLPNLLAVVTHLETQGWKIKKSAAYKHRKEGKIRPQKNGAFRVVDVEKYAAAFLKRTDSGQKQADAMTGLQEERVRAEVDKLKAQAKHWGLKENIAAGRYVEKGTFERELARRAAVFKNDIEIFVRSQAAEIINFVAGNQERTPELIEWLLDRTADWLDRYSADREFTVPLPAATMGSDLNQDEDEADDDTVDISESRMEEL